MPRWPEAVNFAPGKRRRQELERFTRTLMQIGRRALAVDGRTTGARAV